MKLRLCLEVVVLFLSLGLAFVSPVSAGETAGQKCAIPSAQEDYAREAGAKVSQIQFLQMNLDLDGVEPKELSLADEETCGSRGCETIVYQRTGDGCFHRLLEFQGQLKPLEKKTAGLRDLEVTFKDQFPEKPRVRKYRYDARSGAYREVK